MDIYHPSQHEADISNIPYDLDMYINDDPRWSYLIPPYRRVHSPGLIEARGCCLKDDESGRGSER